jgi:hypothetical protein
VARTKRGRLGKKSMELRKGDNSFDWFFLAMAHWQLGEKEQVRK